MNVCPECYYTGNTGVCPECGAEMIPYLDEADDFEEFRRPRERRFISRHGGGVIRVVTLLVIFGLLWFYTGGNIIEAFIPQTGRVVPERIEFTVTKTITLTANSNGSSATYDIFLPEDDKEEYQKVDSIVMEPNGTRDPYNMHHVEWEFDPIPAGEERKIKITYTMRTYTKRQKMSSSDSGTVNDIPQEYIDRYIPGERTEDETGAPEPARDGQQWWNSDAAEWTFDPKNPEVQDIATEIQRGRVKVYDLVKATYEWVLDHWSYDTAGTSLRTCAQMLALSSGDCDDQSVVMISILRAMGIPAWLELGVLYNKQKNLWNGHGWANAIIPKNSGSYVIAQIDVVNEEFMFRDPMRFTDYVDDGNGDHLREYYYVLSSVGVDMETKYRTISYSESGEVWLERNNTPFVGAEGLIVAVAVVLLIYRRRLNR